MILIIESGATKSRWMIVDKFGKTVSDTLLQGMNISTQEVALIEPIIRGAAYSMDVKLVEEVYLYTAGVPSEVSSIQLKHIFSELFPQLKSFNIESDMLAACRAVCGHKEGFVAILGTGSNFCHYDGEKIDRRVNSGGYILGDEGSAARLGILFLSDHIKGLIPEEIESEFAKRFDASYAGIVAKLYSYGGSPSAYLGSLAPFIMEHYQHPYIKDLVDSNFRSFFRRCVKTLGCQLPIGVVGGFGCACKDMIKTIAAEEGVKISCFIPSPAVMLPAFHCGE